MREFGDPSDELVRLREQLAEHRAWLDALPLATVVKDRRGRFLYVNAAAAAGYGRTHTEMIGGIERELLPPGNDADLILAHDRDVFESGRKLTVPGLPFRTHDGREMVLYMTRELVRFCGEPAVLVTAMDVTPTASAARELRQIERRMAETQRLEGLGVMAGGIAHDFNNLLVGVLANADMALRESAGTRVETFLLRLKGAAERLAGLTRQMLAYSGRGHVEIELIDVPALVGESLELLRSNIAPSVRIDAQLPDGLPAINGDRAQLTQVIMNLLINAAEAIGELSGTITLSTRVEYLDSERNASLTVRALRGATDYLCVEVRDDGPGMDEDLRNRIFDPFFSTKRGPGRGLGLASVLGIVRAHQGALQVDSAVGVGTRMRVWLPLAREKARVDRSKRTSAPPSAAPRGHVLVVDDEEVVRSTTRMVLESLGLAVSSAADGDQAVAMAQRVGCDVVLLDMSMPGRTVSDTHRALRAILPEIPILLTSGYCEPATLNALLDKPHTQFIQKPYSIDDLGDCIQRLLR